MTSEVEINDQIVLTDSNSDLDNEDDFTEEKKPLSNCNENVLQLDTTLGEDENCPVCFEPWTSTGDHKLCCLRCGHLFGYSCILRWIKSQGKQGKCPQCNAKAIKGDIRFLYTRNMKVLDTSERDRALADLSSERMARRKAEQESSEFRAKCELLEAELVQLRDELDCIQGSTGLLAKIAGTSQQSTGLKPEGSQTDGYTGQYELTKSILLSNTGNCRVLASCDYLNALCASQPSVNPIFRGFGVRKINTVEQRPLKYIHLHTQPIRDLAFHPDTQDGIMASASLDKSLRLTSMLTDQVVQTYQCPAPVWSCCWSSPDPHRLFAGCSNGSIMVFDIRMTTGYVADLSVPGNSTPVIGLQYMSPDATGNNTRGLLVGQLTKVTFMSEISSHEGLRANLATDDDEQVPMEQSEEPDTTDDVATDARRSPDLFGQSTSTSSSAPPAYLQNSVRYQPYSLPLEGSLVSLSLVPGTHRFLASYRPSQRLPRVRHLLSELVQEVGTQPGDVQLNSSAGPYTCRDVHNLWAGGRMKMLTRARLFLGPERSTDMTAVAGSEEAEGAYVWRCDKGTRLQTLRPPDTTSESPIIDVCPFTSANSNRQGMALLTERSLHLYRWCPTNTAIT